MVVSIATLVGKMIDGQTPEQRAKMWDWYIRDVERWRRLFKLDEPEK